MDPRVEYREATILDTATASDEINTDGLLLVGVITDADFDGTTLQFTTTWTEGGTHVPVHDAAGAAVELTLAASRWTAVPAGTMPGVKRLKVVAGAQTNDTVVGLVFYSVP